ncbi:hypothetical protein D3C80_608680 [compost metagenome]
MRGRDHHADIGAQRPGQHGDGRRRNGAEQEDIEAGCGEAGDQRVFEHIAGKPRILADYDAVAMVTTAENRPDRNAHTHCEVWCHREDVRLSTDTIGTEITACHLNSKSLGHSGKAENSRKRFLARCHKPR